MTLPVPGHEHDETEDPGDELDEAYAEIQDEFPGLDWSDGGDIQAAVSAALKAGFEIGKDFEYRHPD